MQRGTVRPTGRRHFSWCIEKSLHQALREELFFKGLHVSNTWMFVGLCLFWVLHHPTDQQVAHSGQVCHVNKGGKVDSVAFCEVLDSHRITQAGSESHKQSGAIFRNDNAKGMTN